MENIVYVNVKFEYFVEHSSFGGIYRQNINLLHCLSASNNGTVDTCV